MIKIALIIFLTFINLNVMSDENELREIIVYFRLIDNKLLLH